MAGRTGHACALLKTAGDAGNRLFFEAHVDKKTKEDQEFYIPDMMSNEDDETDRKRHSAATIHAKHLLKAHYLVGEARDLIGMLLASLGDEIDARTMQTEAVLKVIDKKLRKAYNGIDKHDSRHTNLFLAYFDLKDKLDGGAG